MTHARRDPCMPDRTHDDQALTALLSEPRRIAVLGASPDPARDSHRVFRVLRDAGHDVLPINPMAPDVAGTPCAKSLKDAVDRWGGPPDVVDVFRSPHHLPGIVEETIESGAKWLWLQLGVVHEAAIETALDAGLEVVVDRCIKIEMHRLV